MRLIGLVLLLFLINSCDCPNCGHMPSRLPHYCLNGHYYSTQREYEAECPTAVDSIRHVYQDLWDSRKEVDCQFGEFSYSGYYIPYGGHFNLSLYLWGLKEAISDTVFIYLARCSENHWYYNCRGFDTNGHMIDTNYVSITYRNFTDSTLNILYSDSACSGMAIPIIEDIIENIIHL